MYRMVAIDLDGTLTNCEKEVSENNKRAIREAIDRGITIILASGRPVIGMEKIARQLGLYELGGYLLAYNGAEIIDCKTGETILKKELPDSYYSWICETARRFHVDALTYDGYGVLSESDTAKYVLQEAFNNGIPIKKVEHLERHIQGAVPKFMVVGEPAVIKKVEAYMNQAYGQEINIFLSEPYFCEVTAKGVKKDSSLVWLAGHLGYSLAELAAIGDGLNDLPMFEAAGLAVAMENADEAVKSRADVVTASNDKDGVAFAIHTYILEKETENAERNT